MRNWKLVLGFSVGASILAGLTVAAILFWFAHRPTSGTDRQITVEIPSGYSLNRTSRLLADKRVIGNRLTFSLFTYLKGKQSAIQAGEYGLSPAMTPAEVLQKITNGETLLHPVTIPEGYRIGEIAGLMADAGLASQEEFIQATRSARWVETLKIPTGNLEGYLFPDTYRFSKSDGIQRMVDTMVETFRQRVMTPENLQKASQLGMSFHEVVTLASLIEKETGQAQERPKIAAVFHNRLKKHMRLQTDPTVIYALANFDGNIRKKDLSVDSPYNTYRVFGLPPGPIASPGLDSVLAALNPENTAALYFVSRQDGSHQFSTNLDDHNRAVIKYQINPTRG